MIPLTYTFFSAIKVWSARNGLNFLRLNSSHGSPQCQTFLCLELVKCITKKLEKPNRKEKCRENYLDIKQLKLLEKLIIMYWTRAKIVFAGKLRNPSFCHIVGMERPFFLLKTGRYWLDLGFKIGLNEKLSMCKETSENIFL